MNAGEDKQKNLEGKQNLKLSPLSLEAFCYICYWRCQRSCTIGPTSCTSTCVLLLTLAKFKRWKDSVACDARRWQLILLTVVHPRYQISPACQQMDPEDQTITWKHFTTIFKCKYFLLSLHLTQICTNNLEVTSYYILLSNPSDSALFLFTVSVPWCFHSLLFNLAGFLDHTLDYISPKLIPAISWQQMVFGYPTETPHQILISAISITIGLNQLGPKSKLKSLLPCSGPSEEGCNYSPQQGRCCHRPK